MAVVFAASLLAGACASSTTRGLPTPTDRGEATQLTGSEAFTCGAHALAIALREGFGLEVSGEVLVREMMDALSPESQAIRRSTGFSMEDLAAAAQRRGVRAIGVELPLEMIQRTPAPAILHLRVQGRYHFGTFLGFEDGRAEVVDPTAGRSHAPLDVLARTWTGYALILEPGD